MDVYQFTFSKSFQSLTRLQEDYRPRTQPLILLCADVDCYLIALSATPYYAQSSVTSDVCMVPSVSVLCYDYIYRGYKSARMKTVLISIILPAVLNN